jgi:phospholipase C
MMPRPSSFGRRQMLKGVAAAGLGLAGVPILGSRATATTTVTERPTGPTSAEAAGMTGTIADVQHVVFLMLENRSFDHIFGTLSGVRGFDDTTVKRPDGGNIFAQYDATAGSYELPFLLSQTNDGQLTPSLSHDWAPQHMALNGGANDNWINAHRSADGATGIFTMGYYTRNEVPYHYALADAFTICDHYHCSLLGPTYPNRLMWQMGSIDPNGLGGGPLLTTDEDVFTDNSGMGVFSYGTFPERLTKAGVSWNAYTDPASNHLLNMFGAFTQYNRPTSTNADDMYNYEHGVVGGTTAKFLADANAGTLPDVSWIFPAAANTEHPSQGTPNAGATFYGPIIEALMASPSWPNTVLFLTYDENDGYFDHVPPVTAPPGTDLEYLTHAAFTDTGDDPSDGIEGPVGLGFRVPNYVISPWSVGGYVNSDLLDHTSGMKFVAKRFGVSLKGLVSDWRLATVGDLSTTMDFTQPVTSARALAPYSASLAAAYAMSQTMLVSTGTETVPNPGVMPTQEAGTRPRRDASTLGPGAEVPEARSAALLVGAGVVGVAAVTAATRRSGRTTSLQPAAAEEDKPNIAGDLA